MRRRLLLNLLPRPLLILWVQLDLALVHCPSINRNNRKGKQTNKQTNKQVEVAHAEAQMQGGSVELHSMQSLICNASKYMEELQRCIGRVQSLIHRVIL